ncbi:MAG: metal-dependent hydrolase [Chthoniobacterales bacterium]|nr:metal-dependent hydrolase [Chthoniobacterales bacterium]
MKLTYYGHSCFGVQVDGTHLLFDPFITPNPKAASIDIKSIPADYILVSHGHFDHVADVEAIAANTGATLVSTFEVVEWFAKRGVEKSHAMNLGGAFTFPFGRVKMTAATHSSSMPDGSYGGNPAGFLVETKQGHFYYSGDTALTRNMKLIGDSASLKFVVLCVGDNFTMGPEDAARAAIFLEAREVVGVHYDTFPPIEIDHAEARSAFADHGLNLHLLGIGKSVEF